MTTRFLLPILTIAASIVLSGCGTTTKYVQPGSSRLVTSVGKIDIQDFAEAADEMTQSLLQFIDAGKLHSSVPGQPALLAIGHIKNSTTQQLNTDLLVKKIRVALNQSGKVQTSTTVAIGNGVPEDPLAADLKKEKEFFGNQKQPRSPDYTLSGEIIELQEHVGRTRQASYVFQLSLSDSSGSAPWEDEKTIIKQGSRPAVGF